MTPLFFGSRRRRLFGVYTPAGSGAARRGAVLCPPFGQEYLRAHRALRQLATMLSAGGCHVMRFDYHGTGDSGGDQLESDLAGWQDDIGSAIEELCDTSGVRRISLVGLRLGATLAARVAAERPRAVEALVLWEPVLRGADLVRELTDPSLQRREAHEQPLQRPASSGGGHEVVGFALTDALATQMQQLDLLDMREALPARTLALTGDPALYARVVSWGQARSVQATLVADDPPWRLDVDQPGVLPVRALQQIVEWAP